MRCPFCKEDKDKVIDSRSSDAGRIIRRRRQCRVCGRRFTTYERLQEILKLTVVKKDGNRVPYDREKIMMGVRKACYKRSVSVQQANDLVDEVEEEIFREHGQEISSRTIGELTMVRLRRLDKVAYVRFASVYREFEDVGQFIAEVHEVMNRPEEMPGQRELFER